MGLIIPVNWISRELPVDATDDLKAMTRAVTEASAFCNTWAKSYEEWDAYTGPDDNDDYTLGAPDEIGRICLEVAKTIFWMNQGHVSRDGEEAPNHEERLEYYRRMLLDIDIAPTRHTKTISLDSNGCMLIARRQRILPYISYVTSATTNIWNFSEHWTIRKGGDYDNEYQDSWYFDASAYSSTMEGTLYYYRTYRIDGKDYMKYNKQVSNNN